MSRKRWLVLGVEQEGLDEPTDAPSRLSPPASRLALWRIRLRATDRMEPTYVLYVSQSQDKAAPYVVGGIAEIDERLPSLEHP